MLNSITIHITIPLGFTNSIHMYIVFVYCTVHNVFIKGLLNKVMCTTGFIYLR